MTRAVYALVKMKVPSCSPNPVQGLLRGNTRLSYPYPSSSPAEFSIFTSRETPTISDDRIFLDTQVKLSYTRMQKKTSFYQIN